MDFFMSSPLHWFALWVIVSAIACPFVGAWLGKYTTEQPKCARCGISEREIDRDFCVHCDDYLKHL